MIVQPSQALFVILVWFLHTNWGSIHTKNQQKHPKNVFIKCKREMVTYMEP